MAYQNVGTPRFYVNEVEWFSAVSGAVIDDAFRTLPVNMNNLITNEFGLSENGFISSSSNNFIALLGHNLSNLQFNIQAGSSPPIEPTDIVNLGTRSNWGYSPTYNGFTIVSSADAFNGFGIYVSGDANCGSIVVGTYYDMPNAPNLSLTMSREYGGINEFTTHNGSSMSNTMWSKPPKWGDLGAWELGTSDPNLSGGDQALAKSGRRTWDLSFSYLQDSDVFPLISNLNSYWVAGYNPDIESGDTLLVSNNFFSQVWHRTMGAGNLPFIFQPDSSNSTPDQFAICRFKDSSLKATQVSPNLYEISLSIEEVW